MNFAEFKKYSQDLSLLTDEILNDLCSLAFSNREGQLSVSVGTRNTETFKKICPAISLPGDFLIGDFIKWGIDLESVHSARIRIYRVQPKSNKVRIEGFYIDKSGNILEKKLYTLRSSGELVIDRYDASGNLVSSNEIEKECLEADWTGPQELIDEVKLKGHEHNFMKKMAKDQVYLVIHQTLHSEI